MNMYKIKIHLDYVNLENNFHFYIIYENYLYIYPKMESFKN